MRNPTQSSYGHATWRCTLPIDPATGRQGLAFTLEDGTAVRLSLDADSTKALRDTLAPGYFSGASGTQSASASLSPNAPRSSPLEGTNTCPPAASAAA